jgi:DNA-binding beta-propeller fold protein YncE
MRKILEWVPTVPLLLLLHLSGCTVVFMNDGGHVKSVAITPSSATIAVGGKQQFTANVTFTDGTILVVTTSNLIWSVTDPTVASISSDGVAKGLKSGSVTITGTFVNVSGTATLTITATGAAQPQISGSAEKLSLTFPGSGQQFIYAANPLEDTISASRVDLLSQQEFEFGSVSVAPAARPVWLAIDPAGQFLFVANHGTRDISIFSIDAASGRLTPVIGSPFPVDAKPWSVAVDPAGQILIVTRFDSSAVSRLRFNPLTGTLSPE